MTERSNVPRKIRGAITDLCSMFYVYIIRSIKFGKFYIGIAQNLEKRLTCHNRGSTQSTKSYRPYQLLYFEKYNTKSEALKREKQIKSYKGGRAFKLLISKMLVAGMAEQTNATVCKTVALTGYLSANLSPSTKHFTWRSRQRTPQNAGRLNRLPKCKS